MAVLRALSQGVGQLRVQDPSPKLFGKDSDIKLLCLRCREFRVEFGASGPKFVQHSELRPRGYSWTLATQIQGFRLGVQKFGRAWFVRASSVPEGFEV